MQAFAIIVDQLAELFAIISYQLAQPLPFVRTNWRSSLTLLDLLAQLYVIIRDEMTQPFAVIRQISAAFSHF